MTGAKSSKLKSFLIFFLVLIMACSLAFAACNTTEEEGDDPNYSQTETDEQEITNGNFEFGTLDAEPDEYPYTSVNGWTRAVDNSAASSTVDSGIIDTEEFNALVDALLEEDDFVDWAKYKYKDKIDEDAIRSEVETELGEDAEDEDIDAEVEERVNDAIRENFKNPGTPTDAVGGKVLMINNYRSSNENDPFTGTAQKYTSSTTITLEKDSYGKISVWVNTGDIVAANNVAYGANIRLANTVSSVTQDEYSVSDIVTDGQWVQYTFYVRANDFLSSTVQVVLGLGYGAGASGNTDHYVSGSAYFDGVYYEQLSEGDEGYEEIDWTDADKPTVQRSSSSEKLEATPYGAAENHSYAFDLNADYYYTDLTQFEAVLSKTASNTTSNIPADATESRTLSETGFTVTQSRNSTTLKLTSPLFTVPAESYVAVSFRLSMNADRLQRTGLTVNAYDSYSGATDNKQATISSLIAEEDGTYTIIVKNNFAADGDYNEDRTFRLEFVFGPTDVAATTDASLYTTGSYTVSDLKLQAGSLNEENYSEDANDATNEKYYDFYSLLNGAADSTNIFSLAAYAGFDADYSEEEDPAYSFTAAYTDTGTITHSPALVSDYMGKYFYETDSTAADRNETAGLINTQYLAEYEKNIPGLTDALNFSGDEDIQPLMIYNGTAGAYGFVSEVQKLSASSYAHVSVRVRVTGTAAAYIYLVNTAHGDGLLDPLSLSFKGDDGNDYTKDLYVKVTPDMMDADGWVTVNFYVASGKDDLSYRIELWNGARVRNAEEQSGETSQGFVFFDEVSVSSSFTESTVLSEALQNDVIEDEYQLYYTRPLTDKEIEYNDTVTDDDDKISYSAGVVWADNFLKYGDSADERKGTFVYAIYNTVNPVESTIPSDDDTTDDGNTSSGCQDYDASTFWLSLSSLLLGVALLAAIVMVIVKSVRRRRKARKSTAKTQYKITSRNKTNAEVKAKNERIAREKATAAAGAADDEDDLSETENANEEPAEEEYTYGDVLEDFSDNDDTVEEIDDPLESEEVPVEPAAPAEESEEKQENGPADEGEKKE